MYSFAAQHVAYLTQRRRKSLSEAVDIAASGLTFTSMLVCYSFMVLLDGMPRGKNTEVTVAVLLAYLAFYQTHLWFIKRQLRVKSDHLAAVWPLMSLLIGSSLLFFAVIAYKTCFGNLSCPR